jgi:hypothetical protein
MQAAVDRVIGQIAKRRAFDSHFLIAQVILHHMPAYVVFRAPGDTDATLHGRIAQLIPRSGLVRRFPQQAWSHNIHGGPSPCALWQRR